MYMMIVIMLILSYLIGAFPSGYVIGKLFFKKDGMMTQNHIVVFWNVEIVS